MNPTLRNLKGAVYMKFASYINRFIMRSGVIQFSHSNLLSSETSSALATVKRPQLSSILMERPAWVSGHVCTIRAVLSAMSSSSSTSIATVRSLTPPERRALWLSTWKIHELNPAFLRTKVCPSSSKSRLKGTAVC